MFVLLAERDKLSFNAVATFRPDILHNIPDFLYPAVLENQTDRSIDGQYLQAMSQAQTNSIPQDTAWHGRRTESTLRQHIQQFIRHQFAVGINGGNGNALPSRASAISGKSFLTSSSPPVRDTCIVIQTENKYMLCKRIMYPAAGVPPVQQNGHSKQSAHHKCRLPRSFLFPDR